MEALTRLVSDSPARHGLDRPVDPRRLQWSRWFRCDSPHSLLVVPSKPGIFALAEEIAAFGNEEHLETAAQARPERPRAERRGVEWGLADHSSAVSAWRPNADAANGLLGGAALQRCNSQPQRDAALAAEGRRMLAVVQFSEDDNMAFVLDRMFTCVNPMRVRLHAGNCFVRFVVVEDQHQRRSICAALNQWMRNSFEKATGFPAEFSSSLETRFDTQDHVERALLSANLSPGSSHVGTRNPDPGVGASTMDSGVNKNLRCPQPFPSGF